MPLDVTPPPTDDAAADIMAMLQLPQDLGWLAAGALALVALAVIALVARARLSD